MPFVFLLLIAVATGVFAAYAGREEVRLCADPIWRVESFAAYMIFVALILVPTALYFYAFEGDWFLFYWVDTSGARSFWGGLTIALVVGAGMLGFQAGSVLARAEREQALRRVTAGLIVLALLCWPIAWGRLSRVGSYRQFNNDYGLDPYFSSPTFYSAMLIAVLASTSFIWLAYRIDRRAHDGV